MISTHNLIHYISALAFIIVAGFHILRLYNGWGLIFRGSPYPLYVTILEIVIALSLATALILTTK